MEREVNARASMMMNTYSMQNSTVPSIGNMRVEQKCALGSRGYLAIKAVKAEKAGRSCVDV